jgi:hypothetical protein
MVLLEKYEDSLSAYRHFRARWSYEDCDPTPGKARSIDEWRICRDGDRVRVQNPGGSEKKGTGFFEAVREVGKTYLNVYPNGPLLGKVHVTRADLLEICGNLPNALRLESSTRCPFRSC